MASDLRKLLAVLKQQGFGVERTKSGHWLVRDAGGRAVATIAGTPSDRRAWLNAVARLRRAGLEWPPKR